MKDRHTDTDKPYKMYKTHTLKKGSIEFVGFEAINVNDLCFVKRVT